MGLKIDEVIRTFCYIEFVGCKTIYGMIKEIIALHHLPFLAATLVLLGCFLFWTLRIKDAILAYFKVPVVDPDCQADLPDHPPLISVIVPAHNEERSIRECIRSVLDQDYPNFELIVVDDRSADDTAAIARSVGKNVKNFRLISVDCLPAGWTGKCHALAVGTRHADGSWLAFLDADSVLTPTALRQCYHLAVSKRVSMVTLSPAFVLKTFWEKALQPVMSGMAQMLHPLVMVNDPKSPVASANGMFYLINREAYRIIGGHHDVKDLAVEDIGIGKRVKAAGLGLLFANGHKLLKTRMYTTFREIINGWTRILAASMNYDWSAAVKHLAVHAVVSMPVMFLALIVYVPQAMAVWPTTWFVLPLAVMVQFTLVSHIYLPQLGVSRKYAPLMPLGNLLLLVVLLLIVKKIVRKDAVQWRGTTYHSSRYQPRDLDPIPSKLCNVSAPQSLPNR